MAQLTVDNKHILGEGKLQFWKNKCGQEELHSNASKPLPAGKKVVYEEDWCVCIYVCVFVVLAVC